MASVRAAADAARKSNVAIVVVGENESTNREAWSEEHLGDRDSLDLLGSQQALIQAVVETGTPTVVLLINGRPLSINYVKEHVPAILEGWYLGEQGGIAAAHVLFGDVNPGGKLPITFPRSVGELPDYYNHKPSANRSYLFAGRQPLFPFGYGLSYTTFHFDNLRVEPETIGTGGNATVRVDVTNTGTREGDEVAELYIHQRVASVTRPVEELRGFRRVRLKPGEKTTVEFPLTPDALSLLDVNLNRVVEPGTFDLLVGPSSAQTAECPAAGGQPLVAGRVLQSDQRCGVRSQRCALRVSSTAGSSGPASLAAMFSVNVVRFPHAHDGRAHHRVGEDESQGRLRHAQGRGQSVAQFLHPGKRFRQIVGTEIPGAPIAPGELGFERHFSSQAAFVERHPGDDANVELPANRKQLVLRILIKDVVDDLDHIDQSATQGFDAVLRLPAIEAESEEANGPVALELLNRLAKFWFVGPTIFPDVKLQEVDRFDSQLAADEAGVLKNVRGGEDLAVSVLRRGGPFQVHRRNLGCGR